MIPRWLRLISEVAGMLQLKNIKVSYGAVEALNGITLKATGGLITGIIGVNGAGKSTCLKAITGLVPTQEGEILFEDAPVKTAAVEERVKLGISQVLEGRRLFSDQSVQNNLLLGAFLRGRGGKDEKKLILEDIEKIYDRFPILRKRRQQMAGSLSGGEQQMLVIGMALMSRPKLLLLDEPSLGLAPKITEEIFEFIKELKESGITILLVEQMAAMTLKNADYVYVFSRGRIVEEGTREKLLQLSDRLSDLYLGQGKTGRGQ